MLATQPQEEEEDQGGEQEEGQIPSPFCAEKGKGGTDRDIET